MKHTSKPTKSGYILKFTLAEEKKGKTFLDKEKPWKLTLSVSGQVGISVTMNFASELDASVTDADEVKALREAMAKDDTAAIAETIKALSKKNILLEPMFRTLIRTKAVERRVSGGIEAVRQFSCNRVEGK